MINNPLNKFKKIIVLLLIISTVTILPSFLLLMASSWGNDDYGLAKLFQLLKLEGLSDRVFHASPRFLSEIILYIYYNLVFLLKKPFTAWFLLVLWFCLILSLFIACKTIVNKFSKVVIHNQNFQETKLHKSELIQISQLLRLKILISLLLSLILFCYFIYVEQPVTMYYVPAVAAPYLLTLSGIILSINFLIGKADNSLISWSEFVSFTLISLMISASWEIGAVYQLVLNSCLLLILLLSKFQSQFKYLPFSRINALGTIKLFISIFVSSSLSLCVIVLIKINRVGSIEVNSSLESALLGDWKNSFVASVARFGKEILFLNTTAWEITNYSHSFFYAIFCKLGLLLIILLIFFKLRINISKPVTNACFIALIPLFITSFITIITTYYQFGEICCPRQISFRGALFGLVTLILGLLFSSKINNLFDKFNDEQSKENNKDKLYILIKKNIGSDFTLILVFSLTFTLLVNLQFNNLKQDIINLNKIINTNNINWRESLDKNNSYAVHQKIPTSYIYRFNIKEGIYSSCASENNNIFAKFYMDYFDKKELYVLPTKVMTLPLKNNYLEYYKNSISRKNQENIHFICRVLHYGSIEQINQVVNTGQVIELKIDEVVEIVGWAINPDKSKAKRIIITVKNDDDLLTNAPLTIPRPDVAEYFKDPNLLNSGWKTTFIPSPEWAGKTITFKAWTYNPDTKIANFSQEFILTFRKM